MLDFLLQNEVILPLSSLNISDVATAIHNYTKTSENGDVDKLPSRLFLNNNDKPVDIDESKAVGTKTKPKKNYLKSWGSNDLLQYINGSMQHNNSVLLLYTASFCGYCALAVTHMVALSRFIVENYDIKITLAKVDMFKNSLPPELSPERLPTAIFLPNQKYVNLNLS